MVGAHGVDHTLRQPGPQRIHIRLLAQWRLTDVLWPVRLVQSFARQVQVHRPGLYENRYPARLCVGADRERAL
jgi:hypothetical protein